MKNCSVCGCELPASIDEFGPINEPVCIIHWLNPPAPAEQGAKLEDEIEELESDIEDLEAEANGLRGELDDIEDEISEKRRKIRELKAPAKAKGDAELAALIEAWNSGKPRKA